MENKTKHRSVSQMNVYTSCAKKYKYQYIDKVNIMTDDPNKSLGLALHKAQEFNYRQKIESKKDLPFEKVNQFMMEFLMDEFKNNKDNENYFKVKYGKLETGEEIMAKAKSMLNLLYYKQMVKTQPLYVELPITLEIKGVEFLMYIDLVDENYIIRDLKTSASSYSENVLDFNTQLIFYALGFRKKFNMKEKGIGLDILVKTKEPKLQVFRGEVSDNQINEALDNLDQIERAIEAKIFPPVNNQMTCSWCDFKDICHEDGGLPDAKELEKKLKNINIKKDEKSKGQLAT